MEGFFKPPTTFGVSEILTLVNYVRKGAVMSFMISNSLTFPFRAPTVVEYNTRLINSSMHAGCGACKGPDPVHVLILKLPPCSLFFILTSRNIRWKEDILLLLREWLKMILLWQFYQGGNIIMWVGYSSPISHLMFPNITWFTLISPPGTFKSEKKKKSTEIKWKSSFCFF